MQLRHHVTIERPLDAVWEAVTDLSTLAGSLPGGVVEDVESDGTHTGSALLPINELVASFRGSARFLEVDEGARRVVLVAQGRGPYGSIELLLKAAIGSAGDRSSTEVRLTGEVQLEGRIATHVATDGGQRPPVLLDRFAHGLAQGIASVVEPHLPSKPGDMSAGAELTPLDLPPGGARRRSRSREVVALGAVVALLLAWLVDRRQRPTACLRRPRPAAEDRTVAIGRRLTGAARVPVGEAREVAQ